MIDCFQWLCWSSNCNLLYINQSSFAGSVRLLDFALHPATENVFFFMNFDFAIVCGARECDFDFDSPFLTILSIGKWQVHAWWRLGSIACSVAVAGAGQTDSLSVAQKSLDIIEYHSKPSNYRSCPRKKLMCLALSEIMSKLHTALRSFIAS